MRGHPEHIEFTGFHPGFHRGDAPE